MEAEWGTSELGRAQTLPPGPTPPSQLAAELATWRRFPPAVSRLLGPRETLPSSWLWRIPIEQEIEEELELHIEMRTLELVARGIEPSAAREQAIRRLGHVASLKRT